VCCDACDQITATIGRRSGEVRGGVIEQSRLPVIVGNAQEIQEALRCVHGSIGVTLQSTARVVQADYRSKCEESGAVRLFREAIDDALAVRGQRTRCRGWPCRRGDQAVVKFSERARLYKARSRVVV
jgi:hypothetical protein